MPLLRRYASLSAAACRSNACISANCSSLILVPSGNASMRLVIMSWLVVVTSNWNCSSSRSPVGRSAGGRYTVLPSSLSGSPRRSLASICEALKSIKPILPVSHICLTRLDFPSPLSPQMKAVIFALAHRVTASLIVAIVAIVLSPLNVIVRGSVTDCKLLGNGIATNHKYCHGLSVQFTLILGGLR